MNGAAMNFEHDEALRDMQNIDSSQLHSPVYHVPTIQPCRQMSHQDYSKEKSYESLRDPFSVEYLHTSEYLDNSSVPLNKTNIEDMWDPRSISNLCCTREPLELPVPQFEIDENYVGVLRSSGGKDLDLDTRIDLLIKSKALSGMHPIFSELIESENSSSDSSESFVNYSKANSRSTTKNKVSPKNEQPSIDQYTFDHPETPLSRPPSPFLSKRAYLFWFNKAIELKQQAKAQEKALLEQATKKLHNTVTTVKNKNEDNQKDERNNLTKYLVKEVSREFKEIIKQEFIREILENSVSASLENWWENQSDKEITLLGLEQNENFDSKSNHSTSAETYSHKTDLKRFGHDNVKSENQGSTSPKEPYPWEKMNEKGKTVINKDKIMGSKDFNKMAELSTKPLITNRVTDTLDQISQIKIPPLPETSNNQGNFLTDGLLEFIRVKRRPFISSSLLETPNLNPESRPIKHLSSIPLDEPIKTEENLSKPILPYDSEIVQDLLGQVISKVEETLCSPKGVQQPLSPMHDPPCPEFATEMDASSKKTVLENEFTSEEIHTNSDKLINETPHVKVCSNVSIEKKFIDTETEELKGISNEKPETIDDISDTKSKVEECTKHFENTEDLSSISNLKLKNTSSSLEKIEDFSDANSKLNECATNTLEKTEDLSDVYLKSEECTTSSFEKANEPSSANLNTNECATPEEYATHSFEKTDTN